MQDLQWFRHYDHNKKSLALMKMPSNRWYPGACTLPDGDVFVVGGVKASGARRRAGAGPGLRPAVRAEHALAATSAAAAPAN